MVITLIINQIKTSLKGGGGSYPGISVGAGDDLLMYNELLMTLIKSTPLIKHLGQKYSHVFTIFINFY